ncbi:hypothetical protein H6G33_10105 [Calothrix sp. FACHB-1219]|uniref:hypothetical protein n=1 Tax=unclassified Calothrix TaxID=2619626 RepID=UPI00168590CC|nr:MULTISPECIES: hypothetical protein [unclassified Calothrix]MBD2201700.1 hypothetical protein [Calothrix sp. FACHB-168]MBD2217386.1 hypothetical protein [Calothrix sp. FACHB-1219]
MSCRRRNDGWSCHSGEWMKMDIIYLPNGKAIKVRRYLLHFVAVLILIGGFSAISNAVSKTGSNILEAHPDLQESCSFVKNI